MKKQEIKSTISRAKLGVDCPMYHQRQIDIIRNFKIYKGFDRKSGKSGFRVAIDFTNFKSIKSKLYKTLKTAKAGFYNYVIQGGGVTK